MLLVIDTCFNACSAALYDAAAGGVLASDYQAMERGHAEALGPMIAQLFATAHAAPPQLTRIVVTRGPGTFTGLRIGLSFAKGMALALGIPLVGIDSLTATLAPHLTAQGIWVAAHQAGGTGLFYWARAHNGVVTGPELGSDTAATAAAGPEGHFLKNPRLAAEDFAAFAWQLPNTDAPGEPLYLRPPDAKPSVATATAAAQVRSVDAADLLTLSEIHRQSFATGWTVDDLKSSLALSGSAALLVELAGTVYGFVQFQWVAGEAEIHTLCVSPNYRGQKFGRDLMDGLMADLARRQTRKVFLEVSSRNIAALALYQRYGFQQHGLRKAYYADGSDALTMVKVLTS